MELPRKLSLSMLTDDIKPGNIRGSLLNLWRARLRGRPPGLLALDIWRALRPCYEAALEGQLSGQQGQHLVEDYCQARGLSEQDTQRLQRLRQHLNQLSHTQDDRAWEMLRSLHADQWLSLIHI